MTEPRDYIIRAGDSDVLVWVEFGAPMPPGALAMTKRSAEDKHSPGPARWINIDGHRYAWSGMQSHATRFTWAEARDVVWNKLKTAPPYPGPAGPLRPDRWRYKLVRLVPSDDTIRPKGKR